MVLATVVQVRGFYEVLDTSTLSETDAMINDLGSSDTALAYKGALMMRRAEYLSGSFNKLNSFKEGKVLLEKAITSNPQNVEFRFIRLMIQENVPWILGYSGEVDEDAEMIVSGYQKQRDDLKLVMKGYASESDALKNKLK